MIEACFCGRTGPIEDRTYIQTADFREGLACPECGHVDFLDYLPESNRLDMLAAAKLRAEEAFDDFALTQRVA